MVQSHRFVEIKQIDVVTQVEDGPAEEIKEEKDIYVPEGYVAIHEEPLEPVDEEHEAYFESGYMTLPDEDPDEDKAQFLYPDNYEDVASSHSFYAVLFRPSTRYS